MDVKKKELIAYRNAKCRERNCGPNRIFTERDIDAILAARPRTVADLAKISGFPMNGERVKKYGDDIIIPLLFMISN